MGFGIVMAVLAGCVLIGIVLHATWFTNRKNGIAPYGELVKVFDGQMHVYRTGTGEQPIVLLPGAGVALPSADFGPLMRLLGQKHEVVALEYFGVGFSSQTARPRTVANYVEEIRAALQAAGIKGPYVLMAHSLSSAYSEYYAVTHPDEVRAIISLDGTSTAYVGEDMPAFVKPLLGVAKVQQAIGLPSLLAPVVTNRAKLLAYGYTEKEIRDQITYAGFSMNDNTLDQLTRSAECIRTISETTYPQSVPYLKIIARQTYETRNSQISVSPEVYQQDHLARVGAGESYHILDGNHFIYLNNATRISALTEEFLATH